MKSSVFIAASFAALAALAAEGRAQSCQSSNPNIANVISQLNNLQYNVQCGSISLKLNAQTKMCINPSGYQNAETCYGRLSLPSRNGSPSSTEIQLDDDEAILTIGNLPPPMYYYGYYTFIDSRIDPTATSTTYVGIKAPIGPVMNQRNADPGLHAGLGGNSYQLFNDTASIITTANTVTLGDIMGTLTSVYGQTIQNDIYVEKLPDDLVNLGSSGTADKLQTLIRLTPFTTSPGQFNAPSVQYMRKPPLAILRVSPKTPRTGIVSATYHLVDDPMPQTKIVAGQVLEQNLFSKVGVNDVQVAINTIVNNVIANRIANGKTLVSMMTPPNYAQLQGRDCIAAFQAGVALAQASGTRLVVTPNMRCLNNSPDADYFGSQPVSFPLGGEIVLVGVNHGVLGSSTHSSVALQSPSQYEAALSHLDLSGSATPFITGLPSGTSSDFYVASFNEACAKGSSNCIYAPGEINLNLVERAYLSPITATMPDYTDIFTSTWLVFN